MPDSREIVFPLGVPLLRPGDVKEKGRGDESSTREPSTPAVTRSREACAANERKFEIKRGIPASWNRETICLKGPRPRRTNTVLAV